MGTAINIAGQKFGELTAIEPTDQRKGGKIVWLCKCSCGADVYVTAKDLRSGNTKSCGHLKKQIKDLTGQRFGKLTVISDTGRAYQGNTIWHCRCDCGNEVDVIGRSLTSGNTRSCGCLNFVPRPAPPDAVNGTRASMLNKTLPSSNTSGIKGVSWCKRSRDWEAYIKFQGRHFHLGHYDDIAEAEKVRKHAESLLFDEFLDFYTELTLYDKEEKKAGRPPKNIRGQRFGKLTALYPTGKRKNTTVVWRCQCDCGALVDVKLNHLTSGHTSSCQTCGIARGAEKRMKYDAPAQRKKRLGDNDLTGIRYGFLVVKGATEKRLNRSVVWKCKCDCGKNILISTSALKNAKKFLRSCGCTNYSRGKYYRVCSVCGDKYEVIPGEIGTVCPFCH